MQKLDGASPSQEKCLKNPQYCQRNVDMNYEHKLKKALNMRNINLVSKGYKHTGSWYFVSDSRRPPFMAKWAQPGYLPFLEYKSRYRYPKFPCDTSTVPQFNHENDKWRMDELDAKWSKDARDLFFFLMVT